MLLLRPQPKAILCIALVSSTAAVLNFPWSTNSELRGYRVRYQNTGAQQICIHSDKCCKIYIDNQNHRLNNYREGEFTVFSYDAKCSPLNTGSIMIHWCTFKCWDHAYVAPATPPYPPPEAWEIQETQHLNGFYMECPKYWKAEVWTIYKEAADTTTWPPSPRSYRKVAECIPSETPPHKVRIVAVDDKGSADSGASSRKAVNLSNGDGYTGIDLELRLGPSRGFSSG